MIFKCKIIKDVLIQKVFQQKMTRSFSIISELVAERNLRNSHNRVRQCDIVAMDKQFSENYKVSNFSTDFDLYRHLRMLVFVYCNTNNI
jgi:hypothetical protein